MVYSPKYANYSGKSYEKSFVSLCDYMDKNYVLKSWKEIDFEELKNKYLPKIKEAEKNNDITLYYDTLYSFVYEMYDGHVGIVFPEEADYEPLILRGYHDYGFSLIRLETGEIVVVNIDNESDAYQKGLRNGTIILKWNNEEINEAISKVNVPHSYPVKENEDMVKPIYLSAMGEEFINVTFVDGEGNTQEINISYKNEKGLRHLQSIGYLNSTRLEEENYSTKMLSNEIGYIRIDSFSTDKDKNIYYLSGKHRYVKKLLKEKMQDLKNKGMKKLVIDLRNNGGGYDNIGVALSELLTDNKYFAYSNGVIKNNSYQKMFVSNIEGTGEFKGLEVLVLTNMGCASACDGTVLYLSKLPNVTIAGISNPEGIDQETGGNVVMPESVVISFPTGIVLNENNEPNVDTKKDRISRNPVDIKIPLTKENIEKIFSKDDYELEWAIDYFKNH